MPPLHPVSDYLDLAHTQAASLFTGVGEVWEALPKIAPWLEANLQPGNSGTYIGNAADSAWIGENVRIGKGTVIYPGAVIQGPAWIGENCRISPGLWIRENTIVGDNVILGNSCELKNCVIFNKSEIPHWNYVGDSILGYYAHLGAGVILSNWRHDHGSIPVLDDRVPGGRLETGLPKFGAIIGDLADIGSNAVLNPGSLIGRRSVLYAGVTWRGSLPAEKIVKLRQEQTIADRR